MEIKIENYLDDEEIKEIVTDELRAQVRKHFINEDNAKRLLSNLSYHIVSEEVEKIVPNHKEVIVNKVAKLISEKDLSFHVYNFDAYNGGKARSLGAKIIEETISQNRDLIKEKVVNTIQEADYSEDAFITFERLAEQFTSNIYEFVELMRGKESK